MTNEDKIGRLAGALYLAVVVTGFFSLIYVPSQTAVSGDPHATVNNIAAHNPLFRAGIAAFLVKQVAFLILPLVLFRLLRLVHQGMAALMVAFAVISVPIALVSLTNKLEVLDIVGGAGGQALASDQLQSRVMLSLGAYENGLMVTTLFWGLWLLPFGYLVMRSGFLPKILGIFLVLGGLGYVIHVFWQILLPKTSFPDYALLPAAIGEIGICLWLLVMGARGRQSSTS